MSRQSSCKKRSDRSSQSRTCRNGLGGCGTAPRNRTRSISTSESTHSTSSESTHSHSTSSESTHSHSSSSESRTRDHNRRCRPTNANRNSTEGDGPEDPGNRKRKFNEAIVKVLSSSSPSKKLKKSRDIQGIYRKARTILRFLGPFINIQSTFVTGSELATTLETTSGPPSALSDDDQAALDIYQKILAFIPGFEDHMEWSQNNDPKGIRDIATFLDRASKKGCSDDCGTLRDTAIHYIPHVKDIPGVVDVPDLDPKKKDTRGFNHHASARMLCPQHLRDKFDEDQEKFCRGVKDGKIDILHNSWPSFLYPESGYNHEVVDGGLLRGPFLLSCYQHVFTRRRTAMKLSQGKSAGKRCIAQIYDMTEVTPETIAYIAVLCRFVLNLKESWSSEDGTFDSSSFFQNIVKLFNDEDWANETLTWWNNWVFGHNPHPQNTTPMDSESPVALVETQRAARRKEAAQAADAAAQASQVAAEERELGAQPEESEPGGDESESATIGEEYDSDGEESESAADSEGRKSVTFDSPSDKEH